MEGFFNLKTMVLELNKIETSEIRERIFIHLDGWALIPTMSTLNKLTILDLFLEQEKWTLNELNKIVKANEGYLNVALRILASQGYLHRSVNNTTDEITLELTHVGKEAFELVDEYDRFYDLIKNYSVRPRNIIAETSNIEALEKAWEALNNFKKSKHSEVKRRMTTHMEGILLGPTMVALGINNKLKELDENSKLTHQKLSLPERTFEWLIKILDSLNFSTQSNHQIKLTPKGLYYIKRASAYGVTISYLPTFAQLGTLLSGNPNELWLNDEEGHERHVYRYMNVWGSGGAHKTYFNKVDKIIIELFNKPIEEQPKGLIDVGCGDGTFIEHVFDIIYKNTKRGKLLKKHPLFIVGADYNQKARIATRDTMTKADIWAEVVFGDISDPDSLDEMLKEKHGIELSDLLNTRTFLDHNRIYKKPKEVMLQCKSDGAFTYRGRRIPNNELFQNLSNHLKSWTPYLKKFGLLLVELHSITPQIASKNIGKTLSTAYDATHGYTDQYIIELTSFLNAANYAGLKPESKYSFKFPPNEKATVSIHLLRAL